MNSGEKRKRSSNFQLSETRLLVDTVLPFKEILENKANDSFHIQEKNNAWEKIADMFNSIGCGEVHRNAKVLKLKYEGIKKLLRRKLAEHKREMYISGSGGPIKMEDYEEKMFSIILGNNNELSNASSFDETEDTTEIMELCSPEMEEITIKNEIDELNEIDEEPPLTNHSPTRIKKWKQFNTRKLKTKKTQFQHARTENMQKLKHQDNEITKQELEIEHLKREHEIRMKILEKELEEKMGILKRNEEEHHLKMRLMEIQLKHKEFELLSKINS